MKLILHLPVCHLLKSGVAALFGPESGTTSSHVQSICDAMEIPHIETRWDIVVKRDRFSINLMPSPKIISKVGYQKMKRTIASFHLFSGLHELDRKLWLENLHHPVPGQPGADEAAGASQVTHTLRHKDCGQETELS